ncbi:LysR family transcriptional regulator [Halioxenophilus sp. WMMB6]|uniref:LysR family transcriptional regulator n=1 Tax=Halioxenophilus sp. WMMB6 TaxID=3073815 RepID=UPI00295ED90C|nr:LysR family transcriptional regulator [Halioxenophilus sp. WMMB6]
MDTKVLAIFVDVMQFLNFADVARLRGLAPSSVSRSIAQLENELGIRLFHRTTRKLEPTEAAERFCERIRPLVEEVESACQLIKDSDNKPQGRLRLTAATVYAQTCIVPLLPEFARRYPELEVELVMTDAQLDLVEEHIDLAIRLGALNDSSLIARRLNNLEFRVCASPGYINHQGVPSSPQELTGRDCLLFHRGEVQAKWLFKDSRGEIESVPVRSRYLITNSAAVLACAEAGMGIVLLADWLVAESIQRGDLVALFPDYQVARQSFDNAVWLVYPSRHYLPLKVRVMVEFLVEHLQRTL